MATKTEIMSGVECANSKLIGNNTVEYSRENGDKVIRFHKTDILTFHKNGSTTINTDGWHTRTIKDRINSFLKNGYIKQEKNIWWFFNKENKKYRFADNMRIGPRGGIYGINKEKKEDALLRLIKKFIVKLSKLEVLPLPESGDCFYCSMRTEKGEVLGDVFKSEHIKSHLKEGYIHGSLIYNAMKNAGMSAYLIALAFSENEKESKQYRDYVKRAMRKYLKQQVGI